MNALLGTVEMTILVLIVAILAGPLLGARLRVPGLLALIFLGMIFGPFGLGWLGRVDLVFDLGSIGILYLMFLAGLGFNVKAFNDNRTSALGFGLLSFVFPFGLSMIAGLSYFETGILAAALLGSMWASNTLVAYPDVRAAGLENTRAVRDAMSGGVVADVLALLILAVASTYAVVEIAEPDALDTGAAPTLPLYLSIPLLVAFTLWLLPRIGEWFFVRVGRSRVQRLLFALAGMAAGATLAVLGGIAGIIGAFLAGLGLNRLVPKNSELMDRIDFVGTSVFIPAFLVSIGLRIDPVALVDWRTILIGVVFLGLVLVGKGLAVLVAAMFVGYSSAERGLIGSLSIGQAASTLAVGQIGLELGLFEQRVVNASILTIVLAALLTSFGTQFYIRRMPPPAPSTGAIGERVLSMSAQPARPWRRWCTSPDGSRAATMGCRSRSPSRPAQTRRPLGSSSPTRGQPPRPQGMTVKACCGSPTPSPTGCWNWPRRRTPHCWCSSGTARDRAPTSSSAATWTPSGQDPLRRPWESI